MTQFLIYIELYSDLEFLFCFSSSSCAVVLSCVRRHRTKILFDWRRESNNSPVLFETKRCQNCVLITCFLATFTFGWPRLDYIVHPLREAKKYATPFTIINLYSYCIRAYHKHLFHSRTHFPEPDTTGSMRQNSKSTSASLALSRLPSTTTKQQQQQQQQQRSYHHIRSSQTASTSFFLIRRRAAKIKIHSNEPTSSQNRTTTERASATDTTSISY